MTNSIDKPTRLTGTPHVLARATRAQRIGAIVALVVVLWLALQLFASVLLPFVAAAVIAYVLDPPTTQLTQLGLPRGAAALLMLLALIAALLLFALLLYPLILAQIAILFGRVPQYAQLVQGWANQEITHLQESFGSDVVNDKLRDLVSSQAGSMLSFTASAVSRVIGGGFALFNVLTLLVVTPVVAFYLLRDWPRMMAMIDSWLPRRYAEVIRAQVREVDRILSAWVRGQALCCLLLAAYYVVGL
jgi:predicted PurR-regulated permease PerM